MRVHFIHNLRPDTYATRFRARLHPYGYLLAPNNSTSALRRYAAALRAAKGELVADNGNYATIGQVRALFTSRGDALWQQVARLERTGRALRPADVPPALRSEYRALARDVAREASRRAPIIHPPEHQLALDPTRLIGVEDITMALWLSLGIEPAYVNYPRADYRRRNEAVAAAAAAQRKTLRPRPSAKAYYPVASAPSYDAAVDAGRAFARQRLTKVAMGFGAFMADDNYTDFLKASRRTIDLPERYPLRYLRTVAVARGFWDGYAAERGRPPAAFHFLGLGAPIMLPLVALCAWGTGELTFDAMSPVFDAVAGTLYTTKPAYLKVRLRKVALNLARSDNARWDCPCPFCRAFTRKHPMRYADGRAWQRRTAAAEVTAAHLKPDGELYAIYPLFSEPVQPALRREVTEARIGHNHWAIEQTVANIRRAAVSRTSLSAHAADVVGAYAASTTPALGRALRVALTLAQLGPAGLGR